MTGQSQLHCNVGVGAIIMRAATHILLVRPTKQAHAEECWTIPGGGVYSGESLEAGIDREVAEETGLAVEAKKILDSFVAKIDGRDWISIVFLVQSFSGVPKIGEPTIAAEVRWHRLHQLPRINEISHIALHRARIGERQE
jgi:8-oxo-dGTP diphosphatase